MTTSMSTWTRRCLVLALLVSACGDDQPAPRAEPPREMPQIPLDDDTEAAPPLPSDPDKAVLQLGAIPAWEAVVQRAQYLARRGQHGVVYGRMGQEIFVLATNQPEPPALYDAAPPPEPPAAIPPVTPPAAQLDAAAEPAPVASVVPQTSGVATPGTGAAPPSPGPLPPRVAESSRRLATGLHWLIDDTEGYGTLAIRVAFPGGKAPAPGTRVAVGGAWTVDEDRRWVWKADSVSVIPAPATPPAAAEAVSPPGHGIAIAPPPRENLRPVSKAIDNGVILFQVAAAPREEGEGWKLQDELGSPIVANLILPGERPSFGGHDMRSPDERWQLKRKFTYWVRIGKVRRKDPLAPAVLNAIGAPARAW
jgi:hypothetical protein